MNEDTKATIEIIDHYWQKGGFYFKIIYTLFLIGVLLGISYGVSYCILDAVCETKGNDVKYCEAIK